MQRSSAWKKITKSLSLSQRAAEIIKKRIISGELCPGQRFVVDTLASGLGISRTPVREALGYLVSQGLVSYDGNSYYVTSYKRKDVHELFELRRSLEILALKESIGSIPESKLLELQVLCQKAKNEMIKNKYDFMTSVDTFFHEMIIEHTKNDRLKDILKSILNQLNLILNWGILTKRIDVRETATIDEYLKFRNFCKKNDFNAASKLLEQHLLDGEDVVMNCLGL